MTTEAPALLDAFGATFLRLHQLTIDADEAQWKAGATPRPIEDTTERSKGPVSDPTTYHLLDGRRLALRSAVIDADTALTRGLRAMQDAITRLEGIQGS